MAGRSIQAKRDKLYSKCAEEPPGHVFNQAYLVNLKVAKDLPELLGICQELVSSNLFQIVTLEGQLCYRVRSQGQAKRLDSLNEKEYLVFSLIESSSTSGIWTKTLKARTNLHQTIITRCLKTLESHSLVKQVKSVRFPGRKIYMLHDISPTEETTGGPWYSEGELDLGFIEELSELIEMFVRSMSWRESARSSASKHASARAPSAAAGAGASTSSAAGGGGGSKHNPKRGAHAHAHAHPLAAWLADPDDDPRFFGPALSTLRHHSSHDVRQLLPHPAGFAEYPTAQDILTKLDSSGVVQDKQLDLVNLRQLLDVLEFDGKIERVGFRRGARRRAGKKHKAREDEDEDDDDGEDFTSGASDTDADVDDDDEEEERDDGHEDEEGDEDADADADADGDTSPAPASKKRKRARADKEPTYRWVRRPEATWAHIDIPRAPRRAKQSQHAASAAPAAEAAAGGAAPDALAPARRDVEDLPAAAAARDKTASTTGKASTSTSKNTSAAVTAAAPDAPPANPNSTGSALGPAIAYAPGPGNGLTEAPCSACPAFRLCGGPVSAGDDALLLGDGGDGGGGAGGTGGARRGPVDAGSCAYFGAWLDA